MSFDQQPHLTGKRLELRPLKVSDFDDLFRVASDPLIWEQHPHRDRHQKDVFADFFSKAIDSGGALAIYDLPKGRLIGSSRYYDYDQTLSEVVIGYTFLERPYWGGLYNKELKSLMVGHAFRQVETVLFYVDALNIRSRRAMEKIGAVHSNTVTDEQSSRKICIYQIQRKNYFNLLSDQRLLPHQEIASVHPLETRCGLLQDEAFHKLEANQADRP